MASYSSKKLRSGLDQHKAADRTASVAEERAVRNGPSPVGPLESKSAGAHGDELNPQASVSGNQEAGPALSQGQQEVLEEEEENNLNSSMGIGPVSHRSLASSGSAAATEGAAVLQKTFRAAHISGKSFGSSGRQADVKGMLRNHLQLTNRLFGLEMCCLGHSY